MWRDANEVNKWPAIKIPFREHQDRVGLVKYATKLRGIWFEETNFGREIEKRRGTHAEDK